MILFYLEIRRPRAIAGTATAHGRRAIASGVRGRQAAQLRAPCRSTLITETDCLKVIDNFRLLLDGMDGMDVEAPLL